MVLELLLNNQVYTLEVKESQAARGSIYKIRIGNKTYQVDYQQLNRSFYSLIIEGRSYPIVASIRSTRGEPPLLEVNLKGKTYPIQVLDEATKRLRTSKKTLAHLGQQIISTPMPGKVIKLLVKVGDSVEVGQGVIVVEAMKMENELRASAPGIVKEIKVKEGTTVNAGEPLVVLV